jgi:hypothetical protein
VKELTSILTHFSCTRDLYSFIKMRSAMGLLAGPGLVLIASINDRKRKRYSIAGGMGKDEKTKG